jgi:hypothetical protein
MANVCCTYSWGNFYCIVANKTFLAKAFLDGKTTFKHNLYINLWNQMNCLVLNGWEPLMTYNISSSRKPFCGPRCLANGLITTTKFKDSNRCNVRPLISWLPIKWKYKVTSYKFQVLCKQGFMFNLTFFSWW